MNAAAFDLGSLMAARRGDGPALWDAYLNPQMTQALAPVGMDRAWARAKGAWVHDRDGNACLDLLAGFGVFSIGRNHPMVRQALHQVLDLGLADMMQLDYPLLAGLLAEKLLSKAPGLERVYFCNSGTEAVEAALKFARAATGRDRVLYCARGFHGLTLGSLSVNGDQAFRAGFGALLPGAAVPFGDLDALETGLARGDVAAFIVEPVVGHGTYVAPPGYLAAAAALCRQAGALLICDEVQSGLGRTGRWFAYQHDDVQPDIVTVAKALSGGFIPAGAVLAKDWIFRRVYRGPADVLRHDGTFGGNAAAMTAGLATLHVIEQEDLVTSAALTGNVLRDGLAALGGEYEMIGEVRGRGLMIGVEFREPRSPALREGYAQLAGLGAEMPALCAAAEMLARGALTMVAAAGLPVLRMTPPLTLSETEVRTALEVSAKALDEMHASNGPVARCA